MKIAIYFMGLEHASAVKWESPVNINWASLVLTWLLVFIFIDE